MATMLLANRGVRDAVWRLVDAAEDASLLCLTMYACGTSSEDGDALVAVASALEDALTPVLCALRQADE